MIERCIFIICLDKKVIEPEKPSLNLKPNDNPITEKYFNNGFVVINTDEQIQKDKNIETKKKNSTSQNNKENLNMTTNNMLNEYQIPCEKKDEVDSSLMTKIAFQMLHGCNSENNSGNRWFDKTMQFIISEDGYCGINYEHSCSEGIVVIELSEHLFRYL